MDKIPVLLCGIGGYGALYLNEILDSEDDSFTLAGVADPFAASSPRLPELEKRGVPVFKGPEEYYASGGRGGLAVIASPIHTHYPYILTGFKYGSNVLCEKPITGDLARLDDLIAKEEASGLFAAVGFQLSFSRNTQLLKEDIMKGLFGKPLE
jgi:predicted dehydrogenase